MTTTNEQNLTPIREQVQEWSADWPSFFASWKQEVGQPTNQPPSPPHTHPEEDVLSIPGGEWRSYLIGKVGKLRMREFCTNGPLVNDVYSSNPRAWNIFPSLSSSISLGNVLQFSAYRSFTSSVKSVPCYFLLCAVIVNGSVFSTSLSTSLSLVCRNVTDFCLLICILQLDCICWLFPGGFRWIPEGFLYRESCHPPIVRVSLLPVRLGSLLFPFLASSIWLRLPGVCRIRVVRAGILVLFTFSEEWLSVFLRWVWGWAVGLPCVAFILLRYFPSMPIFSRVSIINGCWILSNASSASIEMVTWFLFLILLTWCVHLDWFVDVEPSPHAWNKSRWVVVDDPWDVLYSSR